MTRFVDEARVHIKAGDGGHGATSFRREKYIPHGGPDGGHGGKGGSVILQADPGLYTLSDLQELRHYKAQPGGNGQGTNKHGKDGADLVLKVPCGTLVRGEVELLADLVHPGQQVVAARGGQGGRGNSAFATATHRVPRFAERGEPGFEGWITLELKLMADVGFIGLPNAGKSTLLGALTAARPRVAPYPFTTLSPHLGVMGLPGGESAVLADLPGLIEGAHLGAGLGLRFLRHAERTRILVYVLDLAGEADQAPGKALATVQGELEAYRPELLLRPSLVVGNKADLPGADQAAAKLARQLKKQGRELLVISALQGVGLVPLADRVTELLVKLRAAAPVPEAVPEPEYPLVKLPSRRKKVEVERSGEVFLIRSQEVEKAVVMSDLNNDEAVAHLHLRLRRMGVEKALKQAGAVEGDLVQIAGNEFEYHPDPE